MEAAKLNVKMATHNGDTIELKITEKAFKPNEICEVYECPNCGAVIGVKGNIKLKYCYECGSKIEWADDELERECKITEEDIIAVLTEYAPVDVLADYLKSTRRI